MNIYQKKRELYEKLSPNYDGRCTAPLLIDLKTKSIVSNESSDIVRMINNVELGTKDEKAVDLYPSDLVETIEETNEWVYKLLNIGVYMCGFSTQQSAYDNASKDVRMGLNKVDTILKEQPFLCGDTFTEADLRLLPTIIRFDGAYSPLFRAGGAHLRIKDYPNILAWLQRCWDMDGVSSTIDINDAVSSYYRQLFPLNPGGLIPTPITAEEIGLK
jgi:putative glutathione S-transferase